MRVLIVEDEQIIAADLSDQMIELGHCVLDVAASAEQALKIAEHETPDLITVDFQLQGEMGGEDLARTLESRTGAQILYITAFPNVLLREEPGHSSALYVRKPFSSRQIAVAVSAAAERRKPRDSARA